MLSRADFRPYQERMVGFIGGHTHCAAWSFMGSGKTISTLTSFDELRRSGDAKKLLVVAPLRVARGVWDVEAREWAHTRHLRVSKILGTPAQRLAALRSNADVYTINRENLCWLEDQFIQNRKQIRPWPFDMVVLDESSSYKSQSSKRFKAMRRLRKLTKRVVELTGTPAPNRLPDLWAQMFLLDRGQRLGATETAYRERWFRAPELGGYKWTAKPHAAKEIYAAVADIVLSLNESDYMSLPEVIPNFVRVQLQPAAMAQYKRFERTFILEAEGRKVSAVNAGALHVKKWQLANGALYNDDKDAYFVFHDEKLDALVEQIDGSSGPLMVIYNFRHDLERIQQRLAKEYGDNLVVEVLDTQASEDRWNRGEIDVLLLHPESAGHGLNLQKSGCEHIVWFGVTANLEHILQANARLAGGHRRRGGLVISYIVATGTVDDELVELIKEKGDDQEALRRGVAEINNSDWLSLD